MLCFSLPYIYVLFKNKCSFTTGMWSDWKTWSECSETCGGNQTRTRTCEYPNPTQPGSPCPGNSSEQQSCEGCPGNDTDMSFCSNLKKQNKVSSCLLVYFRAADSNTSRTTAAETDTLDNEAFAL